MYLKELLMEKAKLEEIRDDLKKIYSLVTHTSNVDKRNEVDFWAKSIKEESGAVHGLPYLTDEVIHKLDKEIQNIELFLERLEVDYKL